MTSLRSKGFSNQEGVQSNKYKTIGFKYPTLCRNYSSKMPSNAKESRYVYITDFNELKWCVRFKKMF